MTNPRRRFFELPVNDLITLNLILAILLSNGLTSNELNILGNFLCTLGQNMLTIQAVVGALPGDASYTVKGNPSYCPITDQAPAETPTPQELKTEITTLNQRLRQLELLLAPEKAQHDPDKNTDADANQRNRKRDE